MSLKESAQFQSISDASDDDDQELSDEKPNETEHHIEESGQLSEEEGSLDAHHEPQGCLGHQQGREDFLP